MFKNARTTVAGFFLVLLVLTSTGCSSWFDESETSQDIRRLRMESAVMVGQGIEVEGKFFPSLRSTSAMNNRALEQELTYHTALVAAGGDLGNLLAVKVLDFVDGTNAWDAINHFRTESAVMVGQGIEVEGKFFPSLRITSAMNNKALMQEISYHIALIRAGGDLQDPLAEAVLNFVDGTGKWEAIRYLRLQSAVMVGQGCTSKVQPTFRTTSAMDNDVLRQEISYLMSISGSDGCSNFAAFPVTADNDS